jgi:hypothetical protein
MAEVEANEVSYAWDSLIEKHNRYILEGTGYIQCGLPVSYREKIVRFMASESRFQRRLLAQMLLGLVGTTPAEGRMAAALHLPRTPGGPCYLFLVIPRLPSESETQYRQRRGNLLVQHCQLTKLRHPEVQDIVGVAAKPANSDIRSEDLFHFDARVFSEEQRATAQRFLQQPGMGPEMTLRSFPVLPAKVGRNSPCPCGSGNKFKRCCGAPR